MAGFRCVLTRPPGGVLSGPPQLPAHNALTLPPFNARRGGCCGACEVPLVASLPVLAERGCGFGLLQPRFSRPSGPSWAGILVVLSWIYAASSRFGLEHPLKRTSETASMNNVGQVRLMGMAGRTMQQIAR